jgi:hypothetical protein
MKRYLIILITIITLASCSNKNEKFKDIELMSYHWSSRDLKMPYIKFHIYAVIDKSGNTKISVNNIYTRAIPKYFTTKVNYSLIENVIGYSDKFLKDPDMSYDKITKGMMDEASIKLRINQSNSFKTINFINDEFKPGISEFMKLFLFIDSACMNGPYNLLIDTANLSNRRDKFIEYSTILDRTLKPPPPPSTEVDTVR